jgi:glycosyltransferase involved in cell wall biosynthesis
MTTHQETLGDPYRVCLAYCWPGITSSAFGFDADGEPAERTHPRFAYASAFTDPRCRLVDRSPAVDSSASRLTRALKVVPRTIGMIGAFARADVVISYLTPHLLIAAMVKMVRPRLKVVTLRYRLGPHRRGLRAWIDHLKSFAYRRVDRIACLVPSQMEAFVERYGVGPNQVEWMPFGIDTQFFTPGRSVKRKPVIFVPGNHQRDEQTVLELARTGGVHIVRVSNAPWVREVYVPALRDEPELARWLTYEEDVPAERLRDLYRSASAAWIPVIETDEPAGLTSALEAAACGCPLYVPTGLTTEVLDRIVVRH